MTVTVTRRGRGKPRSTWEPGSCYSSSLSSSPHTVQINILIVPRHRPSVLLFDLYSIHDPTVPRGPAPPVGSSVLRSLDNSRTTPLCSRSIPVKASTLRDANKPPDMSSIAIPAPPPNAIECERHHLRDRSKAVASSSSSSSSYSSSPRTPEAPIKTTSHSAQKIAGWAGRAY